MIVPIGEQLYYANTSCTLLKTTLYANELIILPLFFIFTFMFNPLYWDKPLSLLHLNRFHLIKWMSFKKIRQMITLSNICIQPKNNRTKIFIKISFNSDTKTISQFHFVLFVFVLILKINMIKEFILYQNSISGIKTKKKCENQKKKNERK